MPIGLDHIQAAALGSRIYYVGGLSDWPSPSVGTVYIYDAVTDAFAKGARMPRGRDRGAGGVVVHQGQIYVVGGLHDGVSVPWFDVYNPKTNVWTSLPNLPQARDHVSAGVVGDQMYVIGGQVRGKGLIGANTSYDFVTRHWTSGLASLPTLRAGTATAVMNGRIIVIGGEDATSVHDDVEAYNPTTDSWNRLPAMPTARHGIQAAMHQGVAYITAGGAAPRHQTPTDVQEALHFAC